MSKRKTKRPATPTRKGPDTPLEAGSNCRRCDGLCCKYIALEIDTPETRYDFDVLRWYTAHRGVYVYVEDGDWHLHLSTPCEYLGENNRCRAYGVRPKICRKHPESDCEFTGGYDFELELHTPEEVEAYYRKTRGRSFHAKGTILPPSLPRPRKTTKSPKRRSS